jgi:hypothetical protein
MADTYFVLTETYLLRYLMYDLCKWIFFVRLNDGINRNFFKSVLLVHFKVIWVKINVIDYIMITCNLKYGRLHPITWKNITDYDYKLWLPHVCIKGGEAGAFSFKRRLLLLCNSSSATKFQRILWDNFLSYNHQTKHNIHQWLWHKHYFENLL